MINNIHSNSRYLTVYGPYPNGAPSGQVRWNSQGYLEVDAGTYWIPLNTQSAQINLTSEAELLLEWVRDKRAEEQRLQALANQHPAVADAVEQLKTAEQQLKTVAALCEQTT